MKTIVTALIVMLMITTAAQAAWTWEDATWNNQMATPALNTAYEFHPGWNLDTETWYWHNASMIGFNSTGWVDINGGSAKLFAMKFEFSQPLASFQFTTPQMNVHISAIDWIYSTDGTNWTNIWHRDVPPTHTSYPPEATPLQNFTVAENVTQIWIRYDTSPAYSANVVTDGNMKVNVTTVPEPATMLILAVGAVGALARRRRH